MASVWSDCRATVSRQITVTDGHGHLGFCGLAQSLFTHCLGDRKMDIKGGKYPALLEEQRLRFSVPCVHGLKSPAYTVGKTRGAEKYRSGQAGYLIQ